MSSQSRLACGSISTVVVRAVAGKDVSNSSASRGPAVVQNQVMDAFQNSGNCTRQQDGHLEIEAVLGSALEKMTRYQSALRRDLYRAIEMLRPCRRKDVKDAKDVKGTKDVRGTKEVNERCNFDCGADRAYSNLDCTVSAERGGSNDSGVQS